MFPSSFAHGNFTSRLLALLSTPLVLLFMFMMPTAAQAAVSTSSLIELTNQDRIQQGLGSVRENALLDKAAQAKADDMAAKGYFAHTSPDGSTSWSWFKSAGYAYVYAGENLAEGYADAQSVETAWLNSPTHRANIMNGHYTEIGFGTAVGTYQGHEVIFVAAMFGSPQGSAIATQTVKKPVTVAAVTSVAKPVAVATTPVRVVSAAAPVTVLGAKTTNAKQPAPAPVTKKLIAAPSKPATQAAPVAMHAASQPIAIAYAPDTSHSSWFSRLLAYISTGYSRLLAFAAHRISVG